MVGRRARILQFSQLAALAGAAIVVAAARGEFAGTVSILETFGTDGFAVRVYAQFGDPADRLVAVAGTPTSYLDIRIDSGTFFQHPQGGNTPPFEDDLPGVPATLAFDTFVTIGESTNDPNDPDDETFTTPGFAFGASILGNGLDLGQDGVLDGEDTGWFVTPKDDQGLPDGNGLVLLGQLSTEDALVELPHGEFLIQYISGGQSYQVRTAFCFTTGLPCVEGDSNSDSIVDVEDLLNVLGCWGQDPFDCNSGFIAWDNDAVVGVTDLLIVLGAWTVQFAVQIVDADVAVDDEVVDLADLLSLLAAWGPAPGDPADLDEDGRVGTADLLLLLGNWGPVPLTLTPETGPSAFWVDP